MKHTGRFHHITVLKYREGGGYGSISSSDFRSNGRTDQLVPDGEGEHQSVGRSRGDEVTGGADGKRTPRGREWPSTARLGDAGQELNKRSEALRASVRKLPVVSTSQDQGRIHGIAISPSVLREQFLHNTLRWVIVVLIFNRYDPRDSKGLDAKAIPQLVFCSEQKRLKIVLEAKNPEAPYPAK